jgi:hypothetical protein
MVAQRSDCGRGSGLAVGGPGGLRYTCGRGAGVLEIATAIEGREWDRLKPLLHPYLRFEIGF